MAYDGRIYGSNIDGQAASIGANTQINPAYFYKKALIELVKERYFGQLANVRAMPKNMGKTIKQHHYLPLLDDANTNDQGIDASGATIADEVTIEFTTEQGISHYVVATGTDAADALVQAQAKSRLFMANYITPGVDYAADVVLMQAANWTVTEFPAVDASGNLYGSSKDVGYISGKMPALTEAGGRVNRVGFKRKTLEATIEKFGFFDEYTQESLDFDTDADLMMHITRESLRGANEITEDALQIDLLNSAGVIRFAGDAAADIDMSPEGAVADEVTYTDLMKLGIDLDDNRCPKSLTMITGSRMIDTRTVEGARPIYIGSELIPTIKAMTDLHGNPAFIPVNQYADAGNVANGEIGAVDQFRIIVVPEMMRWEGAGAAEGTNPGYRATGGNYDIFPMLTVGSGSFTTIGFQTDGKTVKFKINHKAPGRETADRNDPYGETGFYSIKWYYGFMVLRPEWIGLIKTVATI